MSSPTLIILAAGMGSRYGGLKQLDSVGPSGETMIDYAVFDAINAGFVRVVFVIRQSFADTFREKVGNRYLSQIRVDYVFQELDRLPSGFTLPAGREKPWGTGHAVLVCREKIDGPFAVVNADDFYSRASFEAIAAFFASAEHDAARDHCMVGFPVTKTLSEHGSVSRGICRIDSVGNLRSVTETHGIREQGGRLVGDQSDTPGQQTELAGSEIASMNCWGFQPKIFGHLETLFVEFLERQLGSSRGEFYIPAVVDHLISRDEARVRVLLSDAQWFGVTYRDDKPRVEQAIAELVANEIYPSPLWKASA